MEKLQPLPSQVASTGDGASGVVVAGEEDGDGEGVGVAD